MSSFALFVSKTPMSSFALFVSNMKSLLGWDVYSSEGFDPEHPRLVPVFVIKKRSYATVARQKEKEKGSE